VGTTADEDDLVCAMSVIPNDETDWLRWNRIGMALWRATGGSSAGSSMFDAWSKKCPDYDEDTTAARWEVYSSSPPDRIGAGTIFYEADQADRKWRTKRKKTLDPSDPYTTACTLVVREFTAAGGRTLHYYRGAFWKWTGSYYRLVDDRTMRSEIWDFLSKAQKLVQDKGGTTRVVPFKPSGGNVTNVFDALIAVVQLDETIEAPAWLSDNNTLPAEEFTPATMAYCTCPPGRSTRPRRSSSAS
jgi:hypothetical protein